jgi:hypothetical protein
MTGFASALKIRVICQKFLPRQHKTLLIKLIKEGKNSYNQDSAVNYTFTDLAAISHPVSMLYTKCKKKNLFKT